MTSDPRVDRLDHLSPGQVTEVLALAEAADDVDGTPPLSEHVLLHIRHGGETSAVHLLASAGPGAGPPVIGYAHVDPTDAVAGAAAELTVHPSYRRLGVGRALVRASIAVADQRAGGRLRLWAHGDHPSASALAFELGFRRVRMLLQLRRSLRVAIAEPAFPPGVRLREFRPGADDGAWLAVNAAAFVGHPEQGRWTIDDLRARLREPWFDATGFLLAVDASGTLLGFHWTKVHGQSEPQPAHGHEPIGEVYVLGVAPAAHGTGLGTALTLAGLRLLRDRGLDWAMLYVDESNVAAVHLYERLGFQRWSTDVSFRRGAATGD